MNKKNSNVKRNNKKKAKDMSKVVKIRSKALGLILLTCITLLLGRIAYLQIFEGDRYREITSTQQANRNNKVIPAIRGTIIDRNGYELALSKRVFNMVFNPLNLVKLSADKKASLKELMMTEFEISAEQIDNYINQNSQYVIVKRNLDKEIMEDIKVKLADLKITDVYFEELFKREYMGNTFASHLIGFATAESGRWGVELKYDEYLRGVPGREYMDFENDIPASQIIAAQDGYSVILTIDKNIQNIIEEAMVKLQSQYDPKNINIIAMEPDTGKVLAMSNMPNFDLNNPGDLATYGDLKKFDKDGLTDSDKLNLIWRNGGISDTYEPGSVFKPIVVSSALEENIINLNMTFTCNGSKTIYEDTIKCTAAHGVQTVEDILKNSCNVALMDIADMMGKEKFYTYQKAFGIGSVTGIDLPGEASAETLMHTPSTLGPVQLATSSFGQSFNMTPIQMLNSICTVINGGKLMKPYVVDQVVDKSGSVIYRNNPVEVRRVISTEVSTVMRRYLETVVRIGTGRRAAIEGYAIGGKTATAEKLPRGSGVYVTSFITFAPANNPKVALIVLVDEPVTDSAFGGVVAGPISQEIMEKVLRYMGVQKLTTTKETIDINKEISLANYVDNSVVNAISGLLSDNLSYKIVGNGTKVTKQEPVAGTVLPYNSQVILYVTQETDKLSIMPNLIDKKYEDAVEDLKHVNLKVAENENNKGKIVNKQIPLAGTKLDENTTIILGYK